MTCEPACGIQAAAKACGDDVLRKHSHESCTFTYSTPSMTSVTLSFVIALWLGIGMATSLSECTYAIRSTCRPAERLCSGRRGSKRQVTRTHTRRARQQSLVGSRYSRAAHQRDKDMDAWPQRLQELAKALHDHCGLLGDNPARATSDSTIGLLQNCGGVSHAAHIAQQLLSGLT